jgi:hypothetical protein
MEIKITGLSLDSDDIEYITFWLCDLWQRGVEVATNKFPVSHGRVMRAHYSRKDNFVNVEIKYKP